MDSKVKAVVQDCTTASDEERVTFGEVVGRLIAAGIERYHTDLVRSEKTYFLPDGTSHRVAATSIAATPASAFSPEGVTAAVRSIQAGRIKYGEFCRQIMAAGCVGYLVSMAGRRAVYYGRTGEIHVEPFPQAA